MRATVRRRSCWRRTLRSVEGAHTARIAATLARDHGIDAPIIAAIAAIVDGSIGVEAAIAGLVNRPLKRETE